MNVKRKALLAVAAVLAVGLVALGAWFGVGAYKQNVYSKNLESGNRYYENGSYSNAVLAYQKALDADDQDADAYLGLAQTYEAQGLYELVVTTLEGGIEKTNSARLMLMLDVFLSDHRELAKGDEMPEPTVNESLLMLIGGNSYHDYEMRNGIDSVTASGDGYLVRVAGIAADFIFRNTPEQPNAVTGSGVNPNSLPAEVNLDSVGTLFGVSGEISRESLEAMAFETMEYSYLEEHGSVVILLGNGCRITASCDENGTIPADAWNEVVPMNTAATERDSAAEGEDDGKLTRLYGNTIDATTNRAVAFVSVKIYEGNTSGTPIAETVSDGTGSYEVLVPNGGLVVVLEADGYVAEEKDLFIGSYVDSIYQDYYVSPELATGEIRIVLTWNSTPRDLDSYLVGTLDNGSEVFVSYFNDQSYGSGKLLAALDVDDTNGYGPETTTIYDPNGIYYFRVHDYTGSCMMAQSGATVTVYLPGQSPQTITLSSGYVFENDWDVLVIDHGKLLPAEDRSAYWSSRIQNK